MKQPLAVYRQQIEAVLQEADERARQTDDEDIEAVVEALSQAIERVYALVADHLAEHREGA